MSTRLYLLTAWFVIFFVLQCSSVLVYWRTNGKGLTWGVIVGIALMASIPMAFVAMITNDGC